MLIHNVFIGEQKLVEAVLHASVCLHCLNGLQELVEAVLHMQLDVPCTFTCPIHVDLAVC